MPRLAIAHRYIGVQISFFLLFLILRTLDGVLGVNHVLQPKNGSAA